MWIKSQWIDSACIRGVGILGGWGLVMVAGLHSVGHYVGLGINVSASAPTGLYVYRPISRPLQRGDWVSVTLRKGEMLSFHYRGSPHLLKKVCGLPGEQVIMIKGALWICHATGSPCHFVGRCLLRGQEGQALHCAFTGRQYIPPHHYYLCSTRVIASFDSRYLGWILDTRLEHVLYALHSSVHVRSQ